MKELRLKLILPDLLFFILGLILIATFANISGLADATPDTLESEIEAYVTQNFGSLIGSLTAFILIAFFIGAGLKAFKLRMILEAMKGKDFKLSKIFKDSHRFYWRVIVIKILTFLILLGALILSLFAFSLFARVHELIAWVVATLIMLYFIMALMLKEASLFQKNKSALESIVDSFKTFKKNKFAVVSLLAIILLVNLIFSLVKEFFPESTTLFGTILSMFYLVVVLLISAWGNLLVFNTYKEVKTVTRAVTKKVAKKTSKRVSKKTTKKSSKKRTKKK